MKILQIQTLPRASMVESFAAIPNEYKYDSHFMFSESYEPTLRKEIEQALFNRAMKWIDIDKETPRIYWKQTENKASHSIRHTCTIYYIVRGGRKESDCLSYSVHTLLA
jgi:hypothetical protein